MDIHIDIKNNGDIDKKSLKKMAFFYNALEQGWTITKVNTDRYMFSKKHEGKKEVFLDSYITEFLKDNMDINKLITSSH